MNLANLFDSITIINTVHRTDRREEMRCTLRRVGWEPDGPKVTWFPAIDPKSAAGFTNPAYRGCFLSHLAILNMLRNAGHKRALVLEDDCEFAPDFADRQSEMAGLLDSTPWAIAYLGHGEPISGPPRLAPYNPDTRVWTTHCYAVAGDVLPRFSAYLEAMILRPPGSREGGPMSPDGAFSWFRRDNPDVPTVLAVPPLAYQRSSRSDLTPSWFDRMPVLRNAVGTARAWRRRRRVKA
jgi:glycosyl transferase, family 25